MVLNACFVERTFKNDISAYIIVRTISVYQLINNNILLGSVQGGLHTSHVIMYH